MRSLSLDAIAQRFCPDFYNPRNAHDALYDAKVLREACIEAANEKDMSLIEFFDGFYKRFRN